MDYKKRLIRIGSILFFVVFIGIACKRDIVKVDITDAFERAEISSEGLLFHANTRQKQFSDDEIQSMIYTVSGDAPQLYKAYEIGKDEWQRIINEARRGESFEASVDALQEKVNATAKEKSTVFPTVLSDIAVGMMKEVYFYNNGNISACTFIRGGDMFAYFRDMNMNVLGKGLCQNGVQNETQGNAYDYEHWLLPGEPDISREDALHTAQHYLAELGADLDLFFVEPCTVLNYGLIKSVGWKFVFTREIDGLKSHFRDGQWCTVEPNALPIVGAPWEQEVCIITIDGEGLCQIWWQGATEIISVEKTSTKIVPFNTIRQDLDDWLWKVYVDKDHVEQTMEVQITNVQLGIAMIAVDTEYKEGQYIPCWYIDFKIRWNYGNGSSSWEDEQIIFSAFDGSYIEPRIKDEKLKELL